MDSDKIKDNLLVLGVYLKSEGYPNTLYRLQDLNSSTLFSVSEINIPMWDQRILGKKKPSRIAGNLWRAITSNIIVVCRFLVTKHSSRLYIPYPSVFILFILSYLPKKDKQRHIVADVFISLYDTVILDRKMFKPDGWVAQLLKWVEGRAYKVANILIVDTQQNKQFLSSLFCLPESKITAIPLSTDESNFKNIPYKPPTSETCKVLFIGTLIPLHGINTILEAIFLLSKKSNIQFKIIGDGQDAHLIEAWIDKYGISIEWERAWQSSAQLAIEIDGADICLGIFGVGDKTQRVCPYKIYAYSSIGRAIITGHTRWLIETIGNDAQEIIASVPVSDPVALAVKIRNLAADPELRSKLAKNSREFYSAHLTNKFGLEKLVACLKDDSRSA
jgi:glycosyltransferase involved in cell wall biosynthesis